ncbi:1650_t:CDS:2 [Ambispora gerdemannii]|uniref:1650_t:CDS:1 n=1 Tax=Ambispora gerdemannii TaxID=144530 RepID=A0A9N8YXQ8_9GLOM|nr:1650_t:CDS:2 [Ambispora gerdemannii]
MKNEISQLQDVLDSFSTTKFYAYQLHDQFFQQLVADRVMNNGGSGEEHGGGRGGSSSFVPKALANPRRYYNELRHLKEKCSKLRFNYFELTTREKFLKVILDGQPQKVLFDDTIDEMLTDAQIVQQMLIEEKDIFELEEYDLEKKTNLKNLKNLFQQIENEAIEHEYVSANVEEISNLIKEVEEMEREFAIVNQSASMESKYTMQEAQMILEEQTMQLQRINREILNYKNDITDLKCQYDSMEQEATDLADILKLQEQRAAESIRLAQIKDPKIEETYDWWTSSGQTYCQLLGIDDGDVKFNTTQSSF